MDQQRQDDHLEPIYNSCVPIQYVVLKTSWERWTIKTGVGRGSGRSVLTARHDDDEIYTLNGYHGLNSFEEACFTRVATVNFFACEVNSTV